MNNYSRRKFILLSGKISLIPLFSPLVKFFSKDMSYLKNETLRILNNSKKIEVEWNCGGDEAIVYVTIDGKPIDFDNKYAEELDVYLINYLSLPDVGEFYLEGKGEIIKINKDIYIKYVSELKEFEDLDEAEFNKAKESMENVFSGEKILFKEE